MALTGVMVPAAGDCHAQSWLYPETIASRQPLFDAGREDPPVFLRSFGFWGEAGLYTIGRDDRHRWDATLGGDVELAGAGRWNIRFESALNLIVDPGNNIGFNPRAFVWTQSALIGCRAGASAWEAGLQHRCKHDVDNVELLRTTGAEEQRALIYSSIMARWERLPLTAGPVAIAPLAEAHVYVFVQDQRFPVSTRGVGADVEEYAYAFRGKLAASLPLSGLLTAGVLADARLTLIGASRPRRFTTIRRARIDPGVECFADVRGRAGTMRVFLRYVSMPDDFVTPVPRSSHLLAAGLRLFNW